MTSNTNKINELKKLKEKYDSTRNEYIQLSVERNSLAKETTKFYNNIYSMKNKIANLAAEAIVEGDDILSLVSQLGDLMAEHSRLDEKYTIISQRYNDKIKENNSIHKKIKKLQKEFWRINGIDMLF